MYFKGDFHSHSTKSDGTLSASELISLAKNENIDIMSLTDHDTTDGIEEATLAGKNLGIKIVPGIELSTRHNNESIHVLGYFKDDCYKASNFQEALKEITTFRVERAKKIVKKLKEHFNIEIDYKRVLEIAGGVVARPHIARTIIDAGYNYSLEYIFSNIINESSPAYVPNKNLTLTDGISLLKSVNAVVILAHPVLIKKTPITELLKFDFDGLEAIYPLNKPEDTNKFLDLAKNYNKLVTAGSDFHTASENDTKHGKLGDVSLTGEYLSNFLKALNK